jgi:hypothetical protein
VKKPVKTLNESERLERLEKFVLDLIEITTLQGQTIDVVADSVRMLAGLPADRYQSQEVQP